VADFAALIRPTIAMFAAWQVQRDGPQKGLMCLKTAGDVMAWLYEQSSGNLSLNTIFIGIGYSGHGSGLNNPAAQNQPNIGPIPAGTYTIGAPHTPPDHLGPLALPLYPNPANTMFGRFGFFIHGDNQFGNNTASDGCIIMAHDIRQQIASSDDKTLTVIALA
jgi:hypothetical protein